MNESTRATCIGLGAIVLWSSMIGLVKEVCNAFGAIGGPALMYSLASVFLLLSVGWVPLHRFPKKYLIWGGLLMISYEVFLTLAIGFTKNNRQAIEVGMVNYLWPTFTMVSTIIFCTKKMHWLLLPGVLLSMFGIVWVLGGDEGFSISKTLINIQSNPLSYSLAFLGACLWAAYCVVTIKMSKGVNGITLFFILVALVLWSKYLILGDKGEMHFTLPSITYLVLAAVAMGFGYAAWNVGILKGNVTIITGASYFTPVLSSALSSVLLSSALGLSFWQGSFMVCVGSVLCWLSTKQIKK